MSAPTSAEVALTKAGSICIFAPLLLGFSRIRSDDASVLRSRRVGDTEGKLTQPSASPHVQSVDSLCHVPSAPSIFSVVKTLDAARVQSCPLLRNARHF